MDLTKNRYSSQYRHENVKKEGDTYTVDWDSIEMRMGASEFDLPQLSRMADRGHPTIEAAKKTKDEALQVLKQAKQKLDPKKYDLRALADLIDHVERSKIISIS